MTKPKRSGRHLFEVEVSEADYKLIKKELKGVGVDECTARDIVQECFELGFKKLIVKGDPCWDEED